MYHIRCIKHRVFWIFFSFLLKSPSSFQESGSDLCSVPGNESLEWLLTKGWTNLWTTRETWLLSLGWGNHVRQGKTVAPRDTLLESQSDCFTAVNNLGSGPLDSASSSKDFEKNTHFVGLFRSHSGGLWGLEWVPAGGVWEPLSGENPTEIDSHDQRYVGELVKPIRIYGLKVWLCPSPAVCLSELLTLSVEFASVKCLDRGLAHNTLSVHVS